MTELRGPHAPLSLSVSENGSAVEILILDREFPDATDFWDGNWLNANVTLRTPHFHGTYRTWIRTVELEDFRNALNRLARNEVPAAEFTTMEEQLHLRGRLERRGAVAWTVRGCGDDREAELTFSFETDNASIVKVANELGMILEQYPVIE